MSTAQNLISESQTEDRIVDAEHTPELEAALLAHCDDHTDLDGDVVEFWGDEGPQSEIDGSVDESPWRVHLTRSAAEAQSEPDDDSVPETIRLSLPTYSSSSILSFLARGGDMSKWGLSSAITAASQELDSYEQATAFERAGGEVITLGPRDWKTISEARAA